LLHVSLAIKLRHCIISPNIVFVSYEYQIQHLLFLRRYTALTDWSFVTNTALRLLRGRNWILTYYYTNFKLYYIVLCPTNAPLSHKLSHSYMFRHYRVILRSL